MGRLDSKPGILPPLCPGYGPAAPSFPEGWQVPCSVRNREQKGVLLVPLCTSPWGALLPPGQAGKRLPRG